jgi:hypothetical protein
MNLKGEKMKIEFAPIGIIHSPFTELEGMPIQPAGAAGIKGTVEVFKDFHSGLKDLDGFSHIILLYLFHCSRGFNPPGTLCHAGAQTSEPHRTFHRTTGQDRRQCAAHQKRGYFRRHPPAGHQAVCSRIRCSTGSAGRLARKSQGSRLDPEIG